MKIYKLVYTLNADLARNFIEVEATDRQSAIVLLRNMGREIGLNYKIVSCRKQQSKNVDKELPADAVKFEMQAWICPICGLNRGNGNHQKCSKITQLKHEQERAKKATKRT
jgi:hypothetical protein